MDGDDHGARMSPREGDAHLSVRIRQAPGAASGHHRGVLSHPGVREAIRRPLPQASGARRRSPAREEGAGKVDRRRGLPSGLDSEGAGPVRGQRARRRSRRHDASFPAHGRGGIFGHHPDLAVRRILRGEAMRGEILETVRGVFYASGKTVSEQSVIEDLASDSIDLVELMAVLTNRYRVRIEPDELLRIRTVGDIVDFVLERHGRDPSVRSF
ncbi:MAG: acyl carrier protein [Candidatus Eisenbacteria bacterium]|uniref:Acyl carrier protein n=1 Tax=Eiseniibacteriota bacterium TaxID=2212470 RepID=A0A538SBN0_UNCEI|nr:MAG: acyl carrier protein [Candidatus Eisenbacteria bacterium]